MAETAATAWAAHSRPQVAIAASLEERVREQWLPKVVRERLGRLELRRPGVRRGRVAVPPHVSETLEGARRDSVRQDVVELLDNIAVHARHPAASMHLRMHGGGRASGTSVESGGLRCIAASSTRRVSAHAANEDGSFRASSICFTSCEQSLVGHGSAAGHGQGRRARGDVADGLV